jgi:hypothetical protein
MFRMTITGMVPWSGKRPSDCPPSGTFLTNVRGYYDCSWPVVIGEPKAEFGRSKTSLKKSGIIGIYVA